ncbi:Cilia- and flagella-associated protein 70 [Tritrichomonas musculus]|uniref:Cilia- and flagella-associated protein 70 n=1 Tax=Tritrichomonas musculus TaxID=1915356 RepID=A0ABR2IJI4_9EUKA
MSIEGVLHIGQCAGYPASVSARSHIQVYVTFPDANNKSSNAIPASDTFDIGFDAPFPIDTVSQGCFDKLVSEPLKIIIKAVSSDLRHQTPAFEFQMYLDPLLIHRKVSITADLIGKHCEDGEFDASITAPSIHVSFTLNEPLLSAEESDGSAIMKLKVEKLINLPLAIVKSSLYDEADNKVHTFDYIVAFKFPCGRVLQLVAGTYTFDDPPVVKWTMSPRVFLPAESVKALLEEGANVQIEVRRETNEDYSAFQMNDTIAALVTGHGCFDDSEFTKPGQSHFLCEIPINKMNPEDEPIRVPDPNAQVEEPADQKKGKQAAQRKVASRNTKRKPKKTPTAKDKKQIRVVMSQWSELKENDGFDGHSLLFVDLQFSHALVLKPLVPHPTVKPSDLCRKNPETRSHRLQEATNQYREAVQRLAYEIMNAQKTRQDCQLAIPDFPEDLTPLLNKMPSYHVALEKLRIAITYTFSEFSLAHQPQSEKQMQTLLSILPMYLHDEVAKQLPQIFIPARQPSNPREFLIKESEEAELMNRQEAATELLEELLAMDLSDADAWWLYSCLMLRHNNLARAEECVRRGLTCDPNHLKLSILFASLLTRQEKYTEAIDFLKSAHFMERIVEVVIAILCGLANLPNSKPAVEPNESPLQFAQELLEMKDVVFTEQLIAQEQMAKGETAEVLYMFGRLHYQLHDFSKAVSFLSRAVLLNKTADALLLLGHIEFERERYQDSVKWFTEGLEMKFEQRAALRLGFIYLKTKDYLKAESILFKCSPQSASVLLGLSIASINMNKFRQADDLLNQATVINPRHPDVWANLALFSLKMERSEEAHHAANMAKKWNLTDEDLIKQLKDAKLYDEFEEEEENIIENTEENIDDVDSDN